MSCEEKLEVKRLGPHHPNDIQITQTKSLVLCLYVNDYSFLKVYLLQQK